MVEIHDVLAEVGREPRGLEPADAVLAGDRAAEAGGQVHDLAVGDLRALLLFLILRVEDEQRVRVAVAGVGDDGDRHVAVGRDLLDAEHQIAELRQRNADVLEQQRTFLLHGRDRDPAGRDEGFALLGVGGEVALGGCVAVADLFDDRRLRARVLAGFVGLDDEHALGLTVEAHLQLVLDSVDRGLVHEFEHRGPHGLCDVEDGVRGVGELREHRDDGRRGQLGGDETQGHLGDHAQGPLRADEQLRQGQTSDVLEPGSAELHGPTVGEDDGHSEDVVRGHAVLHAAQSAGVRGDVAADGAELER